MAELIATKHEQIATHIRERITEGEWQPGDRLPSEVNLASEHDCSVGTVRRALSTLIQDGLLRPKKRSGVFVQEKPRHQVIAVMVPTFINPDHAGLVQAVTQSASKRGLTVSLFCSSDDWRNYRDDKRPQFQFIDRFAQMEPAGIITTPIHIPFEQEMRSRMRELAIPYVIVNDFWMECERDHHVYADQAVAACEAVDHLVELGHRQVAFLMHADDQWPAAAAAFRAQIKARGLPEDAAHVIAAEPTEWVERCLGIESSTPITAAIIPYFERSRDFISALRADGISVPGHVSVVCLGGPHHSRSVAEEVTATISPMHDIAERALDILLKKEEGVVCHYKYAPKLRIGSTTAAAFNRHA